MHHQKDKTLVITAGGQGPSAISLAKITVQKGFPPAFVQQTLNAGPGDAGGRAACPIGKGARGQPWAGTFWHPGKQDQLCLPARCSLGTAV